MMSLPELARWRASGGVTFSDALGVRSVSRFYDPLETSFNARRIAQEAFAAGNDVLVLGNFGLSTSWPEQLANIKDAIRFFQTKYLEDPNFATRVDESLARVLSLKLRLYNGSFDRSQVMAPGITKAQEPLLQQHASAISAIAKESIALLSPAARDLPNVMPNVPTRDESIVFITDDRQIRECLDCPPYPAVPPQALQDITVKLYGPNTTGQVDPAKVSSFTFADLAEYNARVSTPMTATAVPAPTAASPPSLLLPTPPGEPPESTPTPAAAPLQIETAIQQASWIVIAMLDANPALTSTQSLRTFLAQSANTLKDKRVIAFALAAPYYLDATEISKLTAYYGVFSRTPDHLEAVVRAFFGEFVPTGASPVSVPGLGYLLIVQTAPDPNQVIPLIPLTAGDTITDTQATPAPLALNIGDRLKLRAGPVLDKNGHIVPDGTEVQFILSYPAERVEQREPPVSTRDGVADTTILIERQGKLQIRAESDPAMNSYVVVVDTTDAVSSIETIRPTPLPTETPSAAMIALEPATPAAEPTAAANASEPAQQPRSSLAGFLIALLGLLGTGAGLWLALNRRWPTAFQSGTRLRAALGVWTLGWLAYALTSVGMPGMGWLGSVLFALAVALAGAAAIVVTAQRRTGAGQNAPS
jgi:beta-N-acetylhexosaminidase